MKTFRFLFIILAATLVLTSCDSGGDPEEEKPQPPTPTVPGKFLTMRCDMPAEASEKTVALTGLTTAITKQVQAIETSWLTVTQQPYTSGTPKVNVACTENKENNRRVMDIVFLANNDRDTLMLTVRQDAASASTGGTDVDNTHDNVTDQPAFARQ